MKARALALLSIMTVVVAVYTTACCCCGPGVPTDTGSGFAVTSHSSLGDVVQATKPVQVAQKY